MWQSTRIAEVTHGKMQGKAFNATSVAIDSRKLQKGALFIAIKGERLDGHDYVAAALSAGAAGAIVDHVPAGMPADAPLIMVGDAHNALVDLAKEARARSKAKIIAVTGSVGKTSTKEAISLALSSSGKVFATAGNLNNHIGLPLSLANLPEDADFGIFELGMNHAGEISTLTHIVYPDIAVITNVEAVHLEFFAGVEAIADAKAEIMEGVVEGGSVVLNRDNAHYEQLRAKAEAAGLKIITFGAHPDSDCCLTAYSLEGQGAYVGTLIRGIPVRYRLQATGRHLAITSVAALAACQAAGVSVFKAAQNLSTFREPEGRGRVHHLQLQQGKVTLIDDCYNASPSSMEAALAKLGELGFASDDEQRTVAVLGDMLELGASAPALHEGLFTPIVRNVIDQIYLSGPLMKHLQAVLPATLVAPHSATSEDLVKTLPAEILDGDIILIKGSRGSRMDLVRDALFAASSSPVKDTNAL